MATQLRRSKRNQPSSTAEEQATKPTPEATTNDAPAGRKRGRKAIAGEDTIEEASTSKKHKNNGATESITEDLPARPRPQDQPLPPFLALPRELRDEIYKHVLGHDGSTTLKPGSRNIATRCGLIGVNNQLCEEFLEAVLFYAPVITTTVKNHNFAHVVTFLNRLSQAQLARLSSRGSKAADQDDPSSKRRIRIIISYTAGARDSRAHLNRWLDRFDVPDKRGKEIEFEYQGDGTYDNGGRKQRPNIRSTASDRWNEEAGKIAAAGRGRRAYGGYWSRYG